MLLVPDITAGTGTEFEETLVCSGSGGLSQSEEQEEYCGNPRPNRTRPLSDKPVSRPRSCRRQPSIGSKLTGSPAFRVHSRTARAIVLHGPLFLTLLMHGTILN